MNLRGRQNAMSSWIKIPRTQQIGHSRATSSQGQFAYRIMFSRNPQRVRVSVISFKKSYIIRHGETELNNKRVLQGRSDHKLNDKGLEQGREAAAWFDQEGIVLSKVYSSPLKRAVPVE